MQTAHTLFLQKDYEAAREYYLEVLPSFPRNFDILKNLAYCFYKRGPKGYAQAASYYSQANQINPDSPEVVDNFARCLIGLNRAAEAAALYQKAAEQPGAPPGAWRKAAEAYGIAGRNKQAEDAYDAYLERSPGDLEARTKLGDLFTREKDYTRAQEQFRIVLTSNPNYSPALIGMARVAAWQDRKEESLLRFDQALRLDPANGEALTGKAFVLLWLNRYQESQALFRKLQKRFPRDREIARGLGQAEAAVRRKELLAAHAAGDPLLVEAFYRERLEKNPADTAALRALAEATATPTRCSESIGYSRKAVELAPADATLELRLARSLALCQQFAEAVTRYRQVLQSDPQSEGMLTELGSALLHARRNSEATEVFRKALQLNPQNSDANLGLALALAADHHYDEALKRYDKILETSPENYDALQGKAFALFWTGKHARSRAIFQRLAANRPSDRQNAEALQNIASAEEEAKWEALRPPRDALPRDWLAYYEKRLASYPNDEAALKGRAYALAQLNDLPAAIRAYRQVVAKYPDDRSATKQLAQLLGQDGQYDESIRLYQDFLKQSPDDVDALENLARVYAWSKQARQALAVYQGLLARHPSDAGYRMEISRLQLRVQDYQGARQSLTAVLAAEPRNHEARLQLAQLNLRDGDRAGALRNFEEVLTQDPKNYTALLGKAQIDYYQGDISQSYAAASEIVQAEPDNFDAVFLLASIEHARHRRRQSRDLLDRAAKLSPGNPEVGAMRERIREESVVTLRTSASFAREIGPPSEFGSRPGLPNEDLRTFSYGGTLGFSLLPRTDSFLSVYALPSESPLGPLRDSLGRQVPTGISGAVAPQQLLYRQSTRFSDRFTFRAGAGTVRFGPQTPVDVPGFTSPRPSAGLDVLGLAGASLGLTRKITLDLDANRSPITYTPTSVRLGVMQNRIGAGLNIFCDSRTTLHFDYAFAHYTSREINQRSLRDDAHFLAADLNRVLFTSHRLSFDAGYEAVAFGFHGRQRGTYMGFFNPDRYQRHLFTPRIYGTLFGPVGYDLPGGIGVQQTSRGGPLTRAWRISPALTFKVSRRFSFGVGYTHYNTAQALGTLRGNAVRLTSDWKLF